MRLAENLSFFSHINARFYLSYDIKITLKSHFWCKNVIFFCHFVRNFVMEAIALPENL